ncbi:MAG: leucine-rich repeat domain-containing protein [Dehalococcoidia bacterium]|nr:leucine-rich repeat domain-containing protein [Dehalococcoidia bacterium]
MPLLGPFSFIVEEVTSAVRLLALCCGAVALLVSCAQSTPTTTFIPTSPSGTPSTATPTPAVTSLPSPASDDSDRAVLVALYNATDGPNWSSNNGWLSAVPIGQWHGVTTDDIGRVTRLFLTNNRLTGEIPPELGNLPNLAWLGLSNNLLSGKIPLELDRLSNLETLLLDGNRLSGEIPAGLGGLPNLTWLYLDNNRLSGEIPPELGSLLSLTWLYLDNNLLSGEIPPELGRLSGLERLRLFNNQLSGEIPPELGNLPNLEYLHLGDNRLGGCIPDALRNVGGMGNDFPTLGLPFCTLAATPTPASGNPDRAALVALYNGTDGPNWSDNSKWMSTSPIGEWHGVATDDGGRVTVLHLQDNRLSGEIPPEMGSLAKMV